MNRQLKIVALLIALIGVLPICHAQQTHMVAFSYDLNGNRISQERSTAKPGENKDMVEDNTSSTSTILDFYKTMQVGLYPNPTRDNLAITIQDKPENLFLLLRITTSTGAVLLEKEFSGNHETIDMTEFPTGVYLFQLIAGDRKHVWKVIKE